MIAKQSNRTPWDLVPNQQEAFLGLMSTTLNAYMSFLRIPFSFYQMEVNATEAATQEGKRLATHVTQQATEAATQQVKQLTREAALQATEAATQQAKQLTEYVIQQATEAATQQVKELATQATQQAIEAATQQVKQLAEQAAQKATEAATQQVKQVTMHATLQATEAATQQVKELATQATQQAMEAATQQVKQFAEQAALQVAEAAGTAAQLQQEQAEVWTFEHPLQEAESHRPLLLQVHRPGIAHAGVNQEGKWIRTYDVPLEEVSPGIWQAYLLDPEINEFTFIWYDPDQPGKVQWEGKNYSLPRQEKRA